MLLTLVCLLQCLSESWLDNYKLVVKTVGGDPCPCCSLVNMVEPQMQAPQRTSRTPSPICSILAHHLLHCMYTGQALL